MNGGDGEPFARAEAEFPGAAWAAIRIVVAFETNRERPMYMSYVFIGRATSGEEIVGLFNESKEWKLLSRSSNTTANHEQLVFELLNRSLSDWSEKIARDIRD